MIDLNLDDLDIDLDDKLGAVAVAAATRQTTLPGNTENWKARVAGLPKNVLHFDLETIPDYARAEQFDLVKPDPLPPEIALADCYPSTEFPDCPLTNLKKMFEGKRYPGEWLTACREAEKAAKKPRQGAFDLLDEVANLEQAKEQEWAQYRKAMAVCPEMNRIVAFGWASGGDDLHSIVAESDEGMILESFWSHSTRHRSVCGYNIAGFDMPTIYIRSALLGITPPKRFDLKPWGGDVIDLMQIRFPRGNATRMKSLAKTLGIPVLTEDMEGSQVETFWNEKRLAEIGEYVESDVFVLQCLHSLYRGYFI